jgi:hypothetical protein
MAMSRVDEHAIEELARGEDAQIVHMQSGAVSALVRSEVEAQLDAAHKYKRSTTRFLQEAKTLATITREIAESCMYSLPRGGKMITGPSVRLAEICASAYGNMQFGSRVIDVEEKEVVALGFCWDMERNNRCAIEARRRITNKSGRRYDDDMITVTGSAAGSVALRNAIFRVIPRAYVDIVYEAARKTAIGDAKSFGARRDEIMMRLTKLGVSQDRVLLRLGKNGVDDISMEDAEVLIGLGTAIKNGDIQLDEAFPTAAPAPVPAAQDGKRISLKGGKKADAAPADGAAQDENQNPPDGAGAATDGKPTAAELAEEAAKLSGK